MKTHRVASLAMLTLWLVGSGCTTLREIPRSQLAARPERKTVRVITRDGLQYEFDYATFTSDSMTGFRHRPEVEGPVDQLATVRFALDDIQRLDARVVDWTRTALIGGGVVAGAVTVGLAKGQKNTGDTGTGSGGGGGKGGIGAPSRAGGGR